MSGLGGYTNSPGGVSLHRSKVVESTDAARVTGSSSVDLESIGWIGSQWDGRDAMNKDRALQALPSIPNTMEPVRGDQPGYAVL
jgi:hypothetical protein